MNKFYTSADRMYSENDRIDIHKTKKSSQKPIKVNINTILNRIKIEEKNETKKNIFLLTTSALAISLSFLFLLF